MFRINPLIGNLIEGGQRKEGRRETKDNDINGEDFNQGMKQRIHGVEWSGRAKDECIYNIDTTKPFMMYSLRNESNLITYKIYIYIYYNNRLIRLAGTSGNKNQPQYINPMKEYNENIT